ncbi:DUF3349 domain-containing protein [Sorangium sp. So ce1151]|uniref:DUF3349 domain-containing protein n=1 Tax=Sorangium sp. So ce1151 TaxID=3133332 RepID=UPI003F62A2FF
MDHRDVPWLERTKDMLRRAFGDGPPESLYRPLLFVLYEHMSNRNLAKSVSVAFNLDYDEVLNDVYDVASKRDISQEEQNAVAQRLEPAGFFEWIRED